MKIAKDVQIPYYLLQHQECLRRLKSGNMKNRLEAQLKKEAAGYRGEKEVRYWLEALPWNDALAIHDLRLSVGMHVFQLDWTLLFPEFMLILECKNIARTLKFGISVRQLVREFNGRKEAFDDPLLQVETHARRMREWLMERHYLSQSYPIETLAVFVSPGEIKAEGLDSDGLWRITTVAELENKIIDLRKRHTHRVLSTEALKQLTSQLISRHRERKKGVVEWIDIRSDELIKGIQCPQCENFSMKWYQRKWHCPTCRFSSRDAHIPTLLHDYPLLFGTKITNKQCRDFLHLESADTARRFLQGLKLPSVGKTKSRTYILSEEMTH
ncbi:MAG: NERD domain-containing protein [Sporolactobacillus sp.]|nr:NERD domain-containing protein [Sporolactobacillus sp.]